MENLFKPIVTNTLHFDRSGRNTYYQLVLTNKDVLFENVGLLPWILVLDYDFE